MSIQLNFHTTTPNWFHKASTKLSCNAGVKLSQEIANNTFLARIMLKPTAEHWMPSVRYKDQLPHFVWIHKDKATDEKSQLSGF